MPTAQIIKYAAAVILAFALGIYGLCQMFTAEVNTASQFDLYFQWAKGAGLVFLAVAIAFTIVDRDDAVRTQDEAEKGKQ